MPTQHKNGRKQMGSHEIGQLRNLVKILQNKLGGSKLHNTKTYEAESESLI
jgi:hypothetical protein